MTTTRKAAATKVAAGPAPKKKLLNVGDIVHLVINGQTLQYYQLLDEDAEYLKFKANVQMSPQTEEVLIPKHAIERIGLPRG